MSGDWGENGEDRIHFKQQLSSIDRMCGVSDTPDTPSQGGGCEGAAAGLVMTLGGAAELVYSLLRGTGHSA